MPPYTLLLELQQMWGKVSTLLTQEIFAGRATEECCALRKLFPTGLRQWSCDHSVKIPQKNQYMRVRDTQSDPYCLWIRAINRVVADNREEVKPVTVGKDERIGVWLKGPRIGWVKPGGREVLWPDHNSSVVVVMGVCHCTRTPFKPAAFCCMNRCLFLSGSCKSR